MQKFDHYYQAAETQADITLDGSWGQGKTTFGGMSAALALAAIEAAIDSDSDKPLRSVSVSFCGPLQTEVPFNIATQSLRQGRSVSHWQAQVHQNDECCTVINACYGSTRNSDIVVSPANQNCGEAGSGQKLPYIAGMTPEFVKHIDFTYVSGGIPFTNSPHDHVHGWMRFSDCDTQITDAHLLALIDAWPPTTLQKLKRVAPCASVTWNVEMITPLADLAKPIEGKDWLYYEADIREAHGGYAHTEARIFSADGALLALSRQLVVVYDRRD
ncbi:MAG: thioesterase family protein [Thalassolituus sp.]|jgi:acyl-CoA thioesterase|uniref:Acyl-CoA thioesterase II n=2 Tax=root TaxID=1 RepID=M5DSM5_9GAMM|nr:thioesterase family protein [Thalassolituus oleivorans]AHK15621.1 TesB family acyl-CoA thioesterase [Thalassolituus oleivorans R6-15]APR66832.1 hypothetical protein CN03_07735 [Thalassolituus oleivorans]MBQ0779281.1 thioesterase family protein [Thalassolituus oleivorans]CCU72508.1 hypothetical protein TOL_2099 [Thalassolituus oleivorans MIL-1]|tara:strand:- start:428 stop:1243 length:816 start_codon:yes stop_codon:yes gene_type:complete